MSFCDSSAEALQRAITPCPKLAKNTYRHRQDRRRQIFYEELAKQLHLLEEPYSPYYKYKPQDVLENNYKLYWNRTLLTDKTVHFNQPDINAGW
jgi:hypothetical protein